MLLPPSENVPDARLVELVAAREFEHFFLRRQRGLAGPRDARQLIVAQSAHVGGDLLAGNALFRVVACAHGGGTKKECQFLVRIVSQRNAS